MSSSLTKRKLDDYADESAFFMTLSPTRMRKDETALTPTGSSSSASAFSPLMSPRPRSTDDDGACIHFFVRMIPAKTLVIHADPRDTVESIHRKIERIAGIPVSEQGLIYRGKQLRREQTLAECNVEKDANLHLIGRMRSTENPRVWRLLTDVVCLVFDLLKNNSVLPPHPTSSPPKSVKSMLLEYLTMTPEKSKTAFEHFQIFNAAGAPTVLVMLYASPHKSNQEMAEDAIRHFIGLSRLILTSTTYAQFFPIVLEFCRSLKKATEDEDRLYCLCRSSLGTMIEGLGFTTVNEHIVLHDVFPFFNELAVMLSDALALSLEPNSSMLLPIGEVVSDFSTFARPMRHAIENDKCCCCPDEVCLIRGYCEEPFRYPVEMVILYRIFDDLLSKLDMCLLKIEDILKLGVPNGETLPVGYHYLAILKELNGISKLYSKCEEIFWETMKRRKDALCYLIVRDAKRSDGHEWLLFHKEVTNFESRRHLTMMLLPEVKDEFEEMYEMLIDRANLLSESFEYIGRADAKSLRAGLFMEFKNEEATGPGVIREWFFLVCQEIFNPQNALFVSCPNDCRRFFPNPASKVDPMHLEYFKFSGRIIALALMHKVQLGIVFDRLFFLLLSEHSITLEDIRDADPYLYSSCKQILEMDSEAVDQDTLSLTFVHEIEQLGTREVTELCTDGENVAVNSKNRGEYVKSLIQHRFVTSIEEQVEEFAKGFADIMTPGYRQISFFQCLDPEDLESILYGSEKEICLDDWRAHTEYHGFKETDAQVSWFWKIVGSMTAEQKKVLLFFWTSMKYLPVEGFRGLASLLYIYKISESDDRLPSSHTCFYRLCFPAYPTFSAMHSRLHIIVQEHVGCSFGTW